jgi:hypothetical protein
MKALAGPWFLNYSNMLKYVWHIHNHIWYSSGISADQQSYWMNYHAQRIGDFVVLFSDYSKYDVTQGVTCIGREHDHYRELGFCDEYWGEPYLKAAASSRVYYKDMMWQVKGTRKSGDLNTSSGNTKNTGEAVWSWWARSCRGTTINPEDTIAVAALGDDNYSLINKSAILHIFKDYNEAKLDFESWQRALGYRAVGGITENPMEGEYLSLRFYPVDGQYVVGKKPGRCLVKIGAMLYSSHRPEKVWLELLNGTLKSYRATSMHVPFLRKYVSVMTEKLSALETRFGDDAKYRMTGTEREPADDTWDSFVELYGPSCDREAEKDFERQLRQRPLKWIHSSAAVDLMFAVDSAM